MRKKERNGILSFSRKREKWIRVHERKKKGIAKKEKGRKKEGCLFDYWWGKGMSLGR